MPIDACNPIGIAYAWIDPYGKVHRTTQGHEEWALRFVQQFPDLKREADTKGGAGSALLFRGWIRFANFTAIQAWDANTPTAAAWRAVVELVRDCAIRTRDLDPFETIIFVEYTVSRAGVYSVADFIERFGGKSDSDAFFKSMMNRVASKLISASGVCDRSDTSYAWVDPHGRVHETPRGHLEWAANYLNNASDDPIRQLLSDGWVRIVNYAFIEVFTPHTPSIAAWKATVGLVTSCAVSHRVDIFSDEVLVEFTESQSDQVYTVADFIERFGGRRDSEAFFTSMMSRTASVARIAARYVAATALLPGREYLRVFNTTRTDIERKLQAEDYVGAMDAFEAMAAQFRPVYETAATIRVQRDDEKRRLQAFRDKIAPLRVLTRPGYIREGIESNTDVWARLTVTVDRIEEIAKYLSRNISRLEGYDAIARDFRHGPFRIVNAYGFRPEEYAAPLEILDSAAAAIRKAGFDSVLYGDVQLVGGKGTGFSGRYDPSNDIVQLNLDAKFRYDTVYTMIHEFGHRHWHIALSDADRETYIAAYNGTAPHLTVGDRQAILDALVQTEFSAARAERLLPPRLGEMLTQYLRERLGVTTQRALQGEWTRRPEELRLRIVVPRMSAYFIGDTRPHSVTEYGRKNPLEDYAEVFAHVVLGKVVDGRAYDRFQAALKRTPVMSRTAATVTIDKAHIDALRRDVLMIARAADNVASIEDIDQVTRAVRAWRDQWDTFAYTLRQDLENRIRQAARPYDPKYNPNPPDKNEAEQYLNHALSPMWEFDTELNRNPRTDEALKDAYGNPWRPPEEVFEDTVKFYIDRGFTREDAIRESQRYHDRRPPSTKEEAEAAAVARWKAEAVKWTRRLREKARKAWDTLNGYIDWLLSWFGGSRPLEIVHPEEEIVSIAGFRVVFRGFAESQYKDKLKAVRVGIERYRQSITARAPILLKMTPPIFVEWTFEPTTSDAAGYYAYNRVNITPWAIGDDIDAFVKVLAHEVGHHVAKTLSADATAAWHRFIHGDYRDLNLRDALAVMDQVGAKSVIDKSLMLEDPILHLQLSTLMHDMSYKNTADWLFADGIRKYLEGGGNPVVRVPIHPITGYAGKNSEEAMCEALGNLVAYGPKAVPDVVLGMLRSVLGGGVKIASRVAAAWLTRTAGSVAVQRQPETQGVSGFMADYNAMTFENPFERDARIWSYATEDGERLPLITTEILRSPYQPEPIWLKSIVSPEGRGKGQASYVLREITRLADKHGVAIWLTPKPFGSLDNALKLNDLKGWYRRHGWVPQKGSVWVRQPLTVGTRTASGSAGFHGWGMSPEAMRMDGPQFTDQKPIPPEDIEAAADYLKEVRPGLLVAYSRGGAVAMLAIRESGVRPKVIWVAPAWRRGWANVSPPSVSGVILHGDQDNAVPLQHSCELAERTGLPLRVIPGRNHVNILKDKTNPSAGIAVPADKVRECAQSMPDWGTTGKGSPDDIAKQEEFARSLTAARRKRPATGDCYEAAGRYIMEHSLMAPSGTEKSNLRLVHGEVAGQGSLEGVTFGHAWVLDGDTVIDRSNGRDIRMPKAIYYALGAIDQIDNVHVYTPEQARDRMLRYKHFGPWDLKTRSGL